MVTFDSNTENCRDGLFWLDDFPVIRFKSDATVDFNLYVDHKLVYSDTFSNTAGVYTDCDLRDLLDEIFDANDLSASEVILNFGKYGSEASLHINTVRRTLRFDGDCRDFIASHFLGLHGGGLPSDGSAKATVAFLPDELDTYYMQMSYVDDAGNRSVWKSANDTYGYVDSISVRTIDVKWPLNHLPEGCRPISLSIVAGNRRISWSLMEDASDFFDYKNLFGAPERMYVRADISSKITHKASVGRIHGRRIRYGFEESEEFTALFGPQMPHALARLSQLSRSAECSWGKINAGKESSIRRIVITEAEFDSESSESLPAPKIKFFADKVTPLCATPPGVRIHTEQFDTPFN